MHNYYPQIKRELKYWLCLSYAREEMEPQLFDTVNELADVDKFFILGFYYRKKVSGIRLLKIYRKSITNILR